MAKNETVGAVRERERERERELYSRKTKGITLVALVITIIVLLILAGISLPVLLGNDGMISKAVESAVKTKFAKIQEEFDLFVSRKMLQNDDFDETTLNAYEEEGSLNYNTKTEEGGNIKTILSETSYEELGIFEVTNGKLLYTVDDKQYAQWAREVGLLVNLYEIEDGVLLSAEMNKTLSEGTGGILTIPSTIKGQKVTSIGEGAFGLAEGISKIILPKGVTEIQKNAFRGNTTLRGIELPEGLLTIGESAFADCTALESISLPDTVIDVGNGAFGNCSSLASIKLSKGMKIVRGIISGTIIEEIEIPEGVEEIEGLAFWYNNNKMKSVKIPSTVKKIGYNWVSPRNITNIEISNNPYYTCEGGILTTSDGAEVITITASAYIDDGKTLVIPKTVKKLKTSLYGTNNKIRLPASIEEVEFSMVITNKIDTVEFYNDKGEIVTEAEHYTNKNGQICNKEGTILYCCYLINATEIKINEGIQEIKGIALRHCAKITSLELPDSLTTLAGMSGFEHLKSLAIGKNVTNIVDGTFSSWTYFTNLTISSENPKYMSEDGAIYIKDSNGNKKELVAVVSNVTTFTVSAEVEKIGNNVFTNKQIESVTIEEGVKEIGNGAFSLCKRLTTIIIPKSVTTVGFQCFSGCANLENVEMQEGLTKICGQMFNSCTKLETITIPSTVTAIEGRAFYGCSELREIVIPSNVTSIGSDAFFSCNKLKTVEIKRKKNAISGSPWGLSVGNAGIKWTGDK